MSAHCTKKAPNQICNLILLFRYLALSLPPHSSLPQPSLLLAATTNKPTTTNHSLDALYELDEDCSDVSLLRAGHGALLEAPVLGRQSKHACNLHAEDFSTSPLARILPCHNETHTQPHIVILKIHTGHRASPQASTRQPLDKPARSCLVGQ